VISRPIFFAFAAILSVALLIWALNRPSGGQSAGSRDGKVPGPNVVAAKGMENQEPAPGAAPINLSRPPTQVLKESLRFEGHNGAITAVGCGGGNLNAASTSKDDKSFRVWDTGTGKEHESNRWQFPVGSDGNSSFDADGGRWTFDEFACIKVVDSGSGKFMRNIELSLGEYSLGVHALSANGRWVAASVHDTANSCCYVRAVEVETNKTYWFRGHKGNQYPGLAAVMVSPDGKSGASAGIDGLYIWDLAEPDAAKERLQFQRDAVICLAFAPDSKSLVAGEKADALILWDARSGDKRVRFDGHIGPVNCVAFSPDGQWVLSGGADRTARLWDVNTGREVARLEGHEGAVTCVAFAGNDKRVLTGSTDKTIRLWNVAALEKAGAVAPPD
jgi:WD40 repeat protein